VEEEDRLVTMIEVVSGGSLLAWRWLEANCFGSRFGSGRSRWRRGRTGSDFWIELGVRISVCWVVGSRCFGENEFGWSDAECFGESRIVVVGRRSCFLERRMVVV
jgi:hypothetical protein